MKKLIYFLAIVLLIVSVTRPVSGEGLNWYCKREKDHRSPLYPPEFSFIKNMNAYGCDTRHTDYSEKEKVIYLTFDAGYENGNVEKTLDILKEKKVHAAFFILGNLVENNTDLVLRMINEGHLVCNHTYSHRDMSKTNESEFLNELKRFEACCLEKTGEEPSKFYRPPEGKFSIENLESAKKSGYKTIFWSFAYADWDNKKQPSAEAAKNKITENLHNGEIMLLHPTSDTNCEILSEVIDVILSEGFRFASLSELD
jgi:peptidoglycan-N-acetylmuramic acid deacetylase